MEKDGQVFAKKKAIVKEKYIKHFGKVTQEIQRTRKLQDNNGEYNQRQIESLKNRHEDEMNRLKSVQEKEARDLNARLMIKQEKQKLTMKNLTETAERLENAINEIDFDDVSSTNENHAVVEARGQLECRDRP